jgi:hypothetical protein
MQISLELEPKQISDVWSPLEFSRGDAAQARPLNGPMAPAFFLPFRFKLQRLFFGILLVLLRLLDFTLSNLVTFAHVRTPLDYLFCPNVC